MLATRLFRFLSTRSEKTENNKQLAKIIPLLKMTTETYSKIIYKSLSSVLNTLQEEQYQHLDGVREVLSKYARFLEEMKEVKNEESVKKYPLVVLEGLDGCGKSTITKRVSNTLNAELMCTPPACISDIRKLFDDLEYKDVRAAFYSLGNYIAAMQIDNILHSRPVVLDRFWHSTVSYALAQSIADHPDRYKMLPKDHCLFEWPEDLLKPNLIVFLEVSENVRLMRMKNRSELTSQETLLQEQQFRFSVTEVYNRIKPSMVYVNSNRKKAKVEETVIKLMEPLMPKD